MLVKRWTKKTLFLLRFWLSKTNNPLFIGYYKHVYRPKKGSLSEKLDALSKSKSSPLFVLQVGANDGISNDPVHKFIKRDKWKGLLIEPQGLVFRNYLQKIYQKDPEIEVLHAAIGSKSDTLPLYKLGFCEDRWATGLASFNKEHLVRAIQSGEVQRQCRKNGITFPDKQSTQITTEEVSVCTVQEILKKYQISNIDLLMIDVESLDFEIVKLFLPEIEPEHIIYEHEHLSDEDIIKCMDLLKRKRYTLQTFGSNTWATKTALSE